ncbi:MAG: hypothetical protein ACRDH5_18340 [bacterium]
MADLKIVTGADPAAGAELTAQVVPADVIWVPLAVIVSLVQGITQTPLPFLILDDGTNNLFEGPGSSAAMVASTTCQFTWALGLPLTGQVGTGTGVRSTGSLARLPLKTGFRIRTITNGIGANSNYGVPRFYVAELTGSDKLTDWL